MSNVATCACVARETQTRERHRERGKRWQKRGADVRHDVRYALHASRARSTQQNPRCCGVYVWPHLSSNTGKWGGASTMAISHQVNRATPYIFTAYRVANCKVILNVKRAPIYKI